MKTSFLVRTLPSVFGTEFGTVTDFQQWFIGEHAPEKIQQEGSENADVDIVVGRLYATPMFFERCRSDYEKDSEINKATLGVDVEHYLYTVNAWLAVLNHFGFDYNYNPSFVQFAARFHQWMYLHAYHKPDDQQTDALKPSQPAYGIKQRHFLGFSMDRAHFINDLGNFFDKYGM